MLPIIQPYPFIFNYFADVKIKTKKTTILSSQRGVSLLYTHPSSGEKEVLLPTKCAIEWEEDMANGSAYSQGLWPGGAGSSICHNFYFILIDF